MLEVLAVRFFNSKDLEESSIGCLTAVTTAIYQRRICSVGEALQFRTKAFPGVRTTIFQTLSNSVFGNISLAVCFFLFLFSRHNLLEKETTSAPYIRTSYSSWWGVVEIDFAGFRNSISKNFLNYNIKDVIFYEHYHKSFTWIYFNLFPKRCWNQQSYVCSTTSLFHYLSCQATTILYQDPKCRHSSEEYFSFVMSMEQRMHKRFLKVPQNKWWFG